MSEQQKVSRRKFLYYGIGGAAVVAGGAAAAYYLMQPSYPTPEQDPLYYAQWPYRPDIVLDNIHEFERQFAPEKVNQAVIAGDYATQIETKLIAGAKDIDTCYAAMSSAERWYEAGWIRNIEDMEPRKVGDVEVLYSWKDAKAALPEGVWKSICAVTDGKPLGLPYFQSTFGNILTNEKLLEAGGYADTKTKTSFYPKNYQELYEQCEAMQKKGVAKSPLLKRWGSEVFQMPHVAQIESMARGDPVFDKNMDPVFDVNTPYGEMLKDWQWLYEKEIVPRGVLNITEGDNITWFETGEYAYTEQHTYDIFTFNDPALSKVAPYCSIVPPLTKNSPIGYLFCPVYVVTSKQQSDWRLARVHRLVQFFGFKDKNGTFYRHKAWMLLTGVGSPYPAVYEDPEVIESMSKRVYRQEDITTMKKLIEAAWLPEYYKVAWIQEWFNDQQTVLQQCVQKQITVEEAINKMRAKAIELKKKYTK